MIRGFLLALIVCSWSISASKNPHFNWNRNRALMGIAKRLQDIPKDIMGLSRLNFNFVDVLPVKRRRRRPGFEKVLKPSKPFLRNPPTQRPLPCQGIACYPKLNTVITQEPEYLYNFVPVASPYGTTEKPIASPISIITFQPEARRTTTTLESSSPEIYTQTPSVYPPQKEETPTIAEQTVQSSITVQKDKTGNKSGYNIRINHDNGYSYISQNMGHPT